MFQEWVKKIVEAFFEDGTPLNDSIIQIAKQNNLNKEEVKRLIEMSNENTLLKRIELGQSQDFDLADPKIIFQALATQEETEKTASEDIKVPQFTYRKEKAVIKLASEQLDDPLIKKQLELTTKKAILDARAKVNEDLMVITQKLWDIMKKVSDLSHIYDEEQLVNFMRSKMKETDELGDLSRKFFNFVAKAVKLKATLNRMDTKEYVEKVAGIGTFLAKKGLKGLFKTTEKTLQVAGKGMATTGKKVGKFVVKNPGKAMLGGFFAADVAGAVKSNFSKPTFISSIPNLTKMQKIAGKGEVAKETFSVFKHMVLPTALTAGTLFALEKGYQAAHSWANRKKAEEAFQQALEEYPELKQKQPQVEKYFETIYRHSPSLATDPLVLGSLLKQFVVFGGPDYRTIADLRATEAKTGIKPVSPFSTMRLQLEENTDSGKLKMGIDTPKIAHEKTANLKGIATAKVKTYLATSPEEVRDIKMKEIEYGVRGKTLGGLAGLASGAYLARKGKLLSKLLAGGAGALAGATIGRGVGTAIADHGKVVTTKIPFYPNRQELVNAILKNRSKAPGAPGYYDEIKRKIWLGF